MTDSPATKLTITDRKKRSYPINVDLCPMVRTHAQFHESFGFPRDVKWPSADKIAAVYLLVSI